MSLYESYLKIRAAAENRALPRAARCHRHLARDPFVVVVYKLAGDPASPLGVLAGTDRDNPRFFCAPEPRNRDLRFGLINPWAEQLLDHLRAHAPGVSDDAPQLVVPNVATGQFLEVLARSVRFPSHSGLIPETTVLAGRHLAWLSEQAEHPGQALVLPMTEALCAHWVTGQSALEDASLPAVLAWLDAPPGGDPLAAAIAAEDRPTAGPASNPQWDKRVLDPLIEEFNERRGRSTDPAIVGPLAEPVAAAVRAALEPAWAGTWRALDLLDALPRAPHAAMRRERDREAWTWWWGYAHRPEARLRNTLSDRQAVRLLAERERDEPVVAAQEAADDPLVFAAQEAEGTGLRGVVVHAEPDRRIVPPGRRNRVLRPLVRLELGHPNTRFASGDVLTWTERLGKVEVEITEATERAVTVEIRSGTNRSGGVAPDLPTRLGREVRLTALETKHGPVRPLHDLTTVWTHREPNVVGYGANDTSTDDASLPRPATTSGGT